MPDEVEKVAVLPGRGVGPLPRYAGTVEADEERPPAGAVEIASDPVAAVREVAPADGLQAERGGDAAEEVAPAAGRLRREVLIHRRRGARRRCRAGSGAEEPGIRLA